MATTYLTQKQAGFALQGNIARWAAVILGFCLVMALISAGVLLLIRYPHALGKLDVVTAPSGAEVWLDGRHVCTSPCTIERVGAGLHTLRVIHEGYLLAEREVLVEAGEQPEAVSFVLQPIKADLPAAFASHEAPTERIAEFLQRAAEAFQRGDWVTPANDNALYYADAVLLIQPDNEPAQAMRAKVRQALMRQAELAASRGDLATAQTTYHLLLNRFPTDERSQAGITRIAELIEANRGQAARFLALAEAAFAAGRYLDPPHNNAYFYLSQVLAHEQGHPQAQALRAEVRQRIQAEAEAHVAKGDLKLAIATYRRLASLFPEDRRLLYRIGQLEQQQLTRQSPPVSAVSIPATRQASRQHPELTGTLRFSATGLVFAAPRGTESLSLAAEDIASLRLVRHQLVVTTTDGTVYRFTGRELKHGVALWQRLRLAHPLTSSPKRESSTPPPHQLE
uniref:Tetratricopeptide repeat domain protein n=1 Tax=Chloracidobacterium thermophilum TaxID=458033 RepID=A8DJF1_9BACT|nr:tetratricopeptide repeat domain protein [Chloracidobacterium thermophilum]